MPETRRAAERGTSAMRLAGVGKRYGRGRWVLRDVDVALPAGAAVTFVGTNGSGKSTLLRLVAGVSRPSRGTISGRPPVIGYVPDRFPASDAMSSIAYLTHVGRIRGLDGPGAQRRGRELLERLELAGGLRTPIRALSKGNAQKVALAQALLVEPDLLVLDEPWSGLDAAAHGVLGEILGEVVAAGGTVVFTDHREATGRRPASTAYGILDGRVTRLAHVAEPARIVVLADSDGRAKRLDWGRLPGVLGAGPDGARLRLTVRDTRSDEFLLTALRHGWTVEEVRRCPR